MAALKQCHTETGPAFFLKKKKLGDYLLVCKKPDDEEVKQSKMLKRREEGITSVCDASGKPRGLMTGQEAGQSGSY